jgi:hypothetical protein
MYLTRDQVHSLLSRLARRFPGAHLIFDGVPHWTSAVATRRLAAEEGTMSIPPMPWPVDGREAASLRSLSDVRDVARLHPPSGRGGLFGLVLPIVDRIPGLRSLVLTVWRVRFE